MSRRRGKGSSRGSVSVKGGRRSVVGNFSWNANVSARGRQNACSVRSQSDWNERKSVCGTLRFFINLETNLWPHFTNGLVMLCETG